MWNYLSLECLVTLHHCEPNAGLNAAGEPPSRVRSVAFSPDGTTLLAGGDDCVGRLWCTQTWQHTARLEGHSGAITGVSFLDSQTEGDQRGDEAFTTEVFGVRVCSTSFLTQSGSSSHSLLGRLPRMDGGRLAAEASGREHRAHRQRRLVATSSEDRTVRVFDLDEGVGACIAVLRDHRDRVW